MSIKKFLSREIPIAKLLGYTHIWHSIVRIFNIKTKHEWMDIDRRHHALVRKWMDANFSRFAEEEYQNLCAEKNNNISIKSGRIIWQLWYQGIRNSPSMIHDCMDSVGRWLNIEKAERRILDEESLNSLENFPNWLMEKYHNGVISKQCFSDIIRFFVLSHYGGVWIDSTIMQTAPLEEHIFEYEFFSIKRTPTVASKAYVPYEKWTAYFLASKANGTIMSMAYSIMCEYWYKFDTLVDYYLVDYIIDFIYRHFPDCKKQIDTLPQTAPDVFWLIENQNKQWSKEEADKVLERTYLYKLNWRFPPKEKENSVYHILVKKINENV